MTTDLTKHLELARRTTAGLAPHNLSTLHRPLRVYFPTCQVCGNADETVADTGLAHPQPERACGDHR